MPGLMPGAQTDMNQQVANLLAGGRPNPTPNPNPGAPSPSGGQQQGQQQQSPTQPAPGQTPSPTYAPDPQNAATLNALLQVHQRDSLMNGLSYDLRSIGASFGTAGQQASKMAALGAPPQSDTLRAIQESQGIMAEATKQNEHNQFMAGADLMGQQLMGLKPGQGAWLAQSGQLPNMLAEHFRAMEPTDAIKNYQQARALMKQQGMSDAQINQLMPPEILTLGPTPDLNQRQWLIEKMQAQQQGKTDFPDYITWQEQHKQQATEVEDAHKNALALPGLASQLGNMEGKADAILKDAPVVQRIMASTSKQAAANAIIRWDGKGADPAQQYGGGAAPTLDADEMRVVSNIRMLHLADYAANFAKAGSSQRLSQQEAKRLGDAADNLSNFTGTIDDFTNRVNDVKSRIGHAMGAAHGEAWDLNNLPVQYRSKLDPSFMDGPNAIKNRPQWAVPVAVNSQEDIDKLPDGQAYKPGPGFGKYSGRILIKGQEQGFED